jgi:hypothetical protein
VTRASLSGVSHLRHSRPHSTDPYSFRKATTGSTRVARRSGATDASAATTAKSSAPPRRLAGSDVVYPPGDKGDSRRVAIVNEEFAKRYWPNADPIGQRLRLSDGPGARIEVVGVSKTGKYWWIGETLTLIGLYALIVYSVARRTREIGIRMAIGAGKSDVLKMVLRQGLMLSIGGTSSVASPAWQSPAC